MNKVETKQKGKKKEKKQVKITKELIKARLINHFKNHIGEENKTNQEEIFQVVMGVNSLAVNGFARFYFWDSINKVIRQLRKENKCFVIKKGGYYFVLKEQFEADYYKAICDKAINGMEKSKVRADDWVENESWKKLKKEVYYDRTEEETENSDEEEETEEEQVEKINKATEKAQSKTKIIKMYDENNNK